MLCDGVMDTLQVGCCLLSGIGRPKSCTVDILDLLASFLTVLQHLIAGQQLFYQVTGMVAVKGPNAPSGHMTFAQLSSCLNTIR